ncbi:cytochrome c [Chitinophagaceae bacterium LWZ2-11]
MKKVFKALLYIVAAIFLFIIIAATYIKVALPNVGPAPAITITPTADRIQRGEYLAKHVMVCMDCHSTRDWAKFAGPLQPGTLGKGGEKFDKSMGFPGTYYAANITPAGIGNWTDGEIFRAITTGVKKDGKPIFPVMPHASYGKLDEDDIKSVVVYLRSLPSITNSVPVSTSDFPMNFIINTIPAKAQLHPIPALKDSVAYGKYITTAAACVECHTPFEKGKFTEGMAFAGGRVMKLSFGTLTTSNITPDKETGIGNWTKETFVNRFKMYADSLVDKKTDTKEMNTIMPWRMYAGMTEQDIAAIYTYLQTLKPVKNSVVKFRPKV